MVGYMARCRLFQVPSCLCLTLTYNLQTLFSLTKIALKATKLTKRAHMYIKKNESSLQMTVNKVGLENANYETK